MATTHTKPDFFAASSISGGVAVASMRETLCVAAADQSAALAMPPTTDIVVMVVAITAVSTSGPIIVATAAPALAIAFWRNAMAAGVLVPLAGLTRRAELVAMSARERWLGLAAGAWLAAHFATWVPSLTYTSVSSAAALGATQPIWAALIVRRSGHHI